MTRFIAFFILLIAVSGCMRVRLPKAIIQSWDARQEKLMWNRIVQEALKENPDLKQARFELKSKSLSRDMAFGGYLPSADASMTRNRVKATAAGEATDSQSYDIDVTQPLFTGFGITSEFLKAKREWEAAKFAYEKTSAGVRFSLRSAFADVLEQNALLDVNQHIAVRKRRNADMINLRYEAGREHQGSLMRAQAIASQADFDVNQTNRQIESKSLLLGRHMGGNFSSSFLINGNLERMVSEISDAKPDFAALADETPQVKNLVKTAESLKAAVASALSVLSPQFNGKYNYGYSGDRSTNLRDSSTVGLTVSIPLFNGGKNAEAIQKARADYNAALQKAESTRDQTIADLASAWSSMKDAKDLVSVRQQFLNAARKRADIVRAQYESGLINFQDFDIAEQELSDSERSYIQSLANALTEQASWDLVQGNTLEEVIHAQ